MKIRNNLAWLLVLAVVLLMGYGVSPAATCAKSKKPGTVKSVLLKIGKKKVTKKTYSMKPGERKKLKVMVSPKKGKKNIKFSTSNRKIAAVSKNGKIAAKRVGTAKIKVVVKLGKTQKTAWVKIRVKKSSGTDKNTVKTERPKTLNPAVDKKSIVVYFSCTDNTKKIAEYIKDGTSSDIYRIEPSLPYTSEDLNYNNVNSRASKESRDATARPMIAGTLSNLADYEIVYLGFPIWWGEAPKIMYTFVEGYDLTGKIIIPFCTSASSGIGNSATNLQTATKGSAIWIAGQRFAGSSSRSEVQQWIQGLDLSKTTSPTGTVAIPEPDSPTQMPFTTKSPDNVQTPEPSGQPLEQPGVTPTPEASGLPSLTERPTQTSKPTETPKPAQTPGVSDVGKNVVVYFSCTDNTKKIAEYLADIVNADLYRIEAAEPYTTADLNYNNSDSRTSKENRDAAARPGIAGELPALEGYTNIYIGYPIWHGQAPKIMYTFVEHYNLSGKTVIPFCTSASSGIGTSATNLQVSDSSPSVWLAGRRFSGSSPRSEIESWVLGLGLSDKQG